MFAKVKKGAILVNATRGAVLTRLILLMQLTMAHYMVLQSILMKMKPTTLHLIGLTKQSKIKRF